MESKDSEFVTTVAFIGSIVLAGLNAIGVRYTVLELPPFWSATLRFIPASLLLFLVTRILRLPLPTGRRLIGAIIYGFLNIGGSYAFLYWALQEVKPGMVLTVMAIIPLLTLLFAILHRLEKFRWQMFIGSLLTVGGIAFVFSEQLRSHVSLASLLAVLLGSACIAEASVLLKKLPGNHPITTNFIGMASGSVVLFLTSLVFREPRIIPVQANTWIALIYLILLGSNVFTLFTIVIKRWTASATSYLFVLSPFVAISVSVLLGQDHLSLFLLIGTALVIGGVLIGISKTRIPGRLLRPSK